MEKNISTETEIVDKNTEEFILCKNKMRAIRRKNNFKKRNQKLQIAKNADAWYPASIWLGERGQIKIYTGSAKKYFKNQSNRAVRHYGKGISDGGNYRKIYDYQWKIS